MKREFNAIIEMDVAMRAKVEELFGNEI